MADTPQFPGARTHLGGTAGARRRPLVAPAPADERAMVTDAS